jgi:hypothetical protein
MNAKEINLYAICSTAIACAFLFTSWGREGWIFNASILYAGVVFGNLLTEAMN